MDNKDTPEIDWNGVNKELAGAMSQAYLGNPDIELAPGVEICSRSPFIELHSNRDDAPVYINLERIVLITSGESGAIIRTTSDALGISVNESYEEVVRIIEG